MTKANLILEETKNCLLLHHVEANEVVIHFMLLIDPWLLQNQVHHVRVIKHPGQKNETRNSGATDVMLEKGHIIHSQFYCSNRWRKQYRFWPFDTYNFTLHNTCRSSDVQKCFLPPFFENYCSFWLNYDAAIHGYDDLAQNRFWATAYWTYHLFPIQNVQIKWEKKETNSAKLIADKLWTSYESAIKYNNKIYLHARCTGPTYSRSHAGACLCAVWQQNFDNKSEKCVYDSYHACSNSCIWYKREPNRKEKIQMNFIEQHICTYIDWRNK